MRGAGTALSLTLALAAAATLGGCRRDPSAARAYADDAENHDFALDLPRRRVVYVQGAYPRKSYLRVQPVDGGRAAKFRFKGYALGGGVFPLPDGTALVAATPLGGGMNSPRARPLPTALLRVSLSSGEVLQALGLPRGAKVLGAGRSSWEGRPAAVLAEEDGLHLSPLSDAVTIGDDPPMFKDRAEFAALSDDGSALAATAFDQKGGKVLVMGSSWPREIRVRSPGFVRPMGPGRWLLSLVDEEDRDVLASLDGASGEVKVLATLDGPVETAAAGPRWLFAVSLSSKGPFDARRKWLHPREIRRVDLTGQEPPWSAPWTQHQGSLLAVDEDAGRLWFAVTDRDAAAVWSLPLDPGKIAAAVPSIDGRGALARAAALGVFWLLVIVIGTAASMAGWFFIRRGPR